MVLAIFALLVSSCTTMRSAASGVGSFAAEAREGVAHKPDNKPEAPAAPAAGQSKSSPTELPTDVKSAQGNSEEKEGWAERNIPGWKTLAALLPPPNEARQKWDEFNKSQSGPKSDQKQQASW